MWFASLYLYVPPFFLVRCDWSAFTHVPTTKCRVLYNIKCAVLIVEEKRALQSQAKSDKSSAPQPAPPTPPSILSPRTIFLLDFFYIYLWLSSNPPFQVLQAILTDLKMSKLLSSMRWSSISGSLPERLNSIVTLIFFSHLMKTFSFQRYNPASTSEKIINNFIAASLWVKSTAQDTWALWSQKITILAAMCNKM